MKRSSAKPKTPKGKTADGADFFRKASAAMRRAQKVAERENARYGMKLVLADRYVRLRSRPSRPSRRNLVNEEFK